MSSPERTWPPAGGPRSRGRTPRRAPPPGCCAPARGPERWRQTRRCGRRPRQSIARQMGGGHEVLHKPSPAGAAAATARARAERRGSLASAPHAAAGIGGAGKHAQAHLLGVVRPELGVAGGLGGEEGGAEAGAPLLPKPHPLVVLLISNQVVVIQQVLVPRRHAASGLGPGPPGAGAAPRRSTLRGAEGSGELRWGRRGAGRRL